MDPDPNVFTPGTVEFKQSYTMDETENRLTGTYTITVMEADGTVQFTSTFPASAVRMGFDAEEADATPIS